MSKSVTALVPAIRGKSISNAIESIQTQIYYIQRVLVVEDSLN